MSAKKLRRGLVLGLLVVSVGAGVGQTLSSASPGETDWGSGTSNVYVDTPTAFDGMQSARVESLETDWG